MTPLLSVWPSELTEFLALKVSARMEESGGGKVMHRAMRCASMTAAELAAKISAAYREMMPLDAVDTVLHTVVVLPLWEEDSLDRLRKVTEAVRLCPDQISLLVIGLQENLRHICEPDIDPASRSLMREKGGGRKAYRDPLQRGGEGFPARIPDRHRRLYSQRRSYRLHS